ncbi:MAG: tRNA pseudouridine(38-40) synthase TruA [Candidatus Tantalella remota]|nr:tRNA pseudouridine(38-40) synthase TruA [Candidatus Tantalella remota]
MRNIKLTISYDGAAYKGWQLQKTGSTVQGKLEKAIKEVFGKEHRLHGAGRTDSGVHAKGQVAHFKTASRIPVEKISPAFNALLPDDIVVKRTEEVADKFHSRFDAKSKLYRYNILNSRQRDPFEERYTWRVPYKLNLTRMRKEAAELLGRHDFKSFQASDKRERSSVREISTIKLRKKGKMITLDIEGDGFLYNMVRNIAGTLVDIGRGYLSAGSMKEIIETKDRTKAGPTAPAKGLFLIEVRY